MNINKLIQKTPHGLKYLCFGSLMNIDKLIHNKAYNCSSLSFGSLMNIDKLIPVTIPLTLDLRFGSLMNIKLKETACGILFCKLLFYNQRGDRGTAFFGTI